MAVKTIRASLIILLLILSAGGPEAHGVPRALTDSECRVVYESIGLGAEMYTWGVNCRSWEERRDDPVNRTLQRCKTVALTNDGWWVVEEYDPVHLDRGGGALQRDWGWTYFGTCQRDE